MTTMMFLLPSLLIVLCCAQEHLTPRAIPPHLHASIPKSVGQGAGLATMSATLDALLDDTMDVTVAWANLDKYSVSSNDWIGVFDRTLLEQFHAPVKFKYVFARGERSLHNNGTMKFRLSNFRSSYVFIYITGNQQFPEIVAQSRVISFPNVKQPMGVHLALAPNEPGSMLVMWNQLQPKNPVLKWGLSPDKLDDTAKATSDTYTQRDFCDVEVAPAARQGWFEPGLFLTAKMAVLPDTTYYYSCGDPDEGWSKVFNFTTPPSAKNRSTKMVILADLGNAPSDGSHQHSWDFQNRGELPSLNSTRLAESLMNRQDGANLVVHVGDIAYSVGYLSEWDEFMQQIQPVASRIPWMASIGNHEMGWSASDFTSDGILRTAADSGGECGVAFLKRFPYAMQPLRPGVTTREAEAWYSFDVGPVHFTMLSSEHDFTIGSRQYEWMVNDLERVDRSATPWLAVTSHRPMYIASIYDGDVSVSTLLQKQLEPVLLKYGVDFFFAGHHHSYQRFCRINDGKCDEDKGIYHFVLGMSGYDHSRLPSNVSFPNAKFLDDSHWGVTYWEFNETVATMQFIEGATDKVLDEFSISKPAIRTAPLIAI